MDVNVINELKSGLSAAYINGSVAANLAYALKDNGVIYTSFNTVILKENAMGVILQILQKILLKNLLK